MIDPRWQRLTAVELQRAERDDMRSMSLEAKIAHFKTERRVARVATILGGGVRCALLLGASSVATTYGFTQSDTQNRVIGISLGVALTLFVVHTIGRLLTRLNTLRPASELE